jgi:hypothetical protein
VAFPVWGSILDDIWTLEERSASTRRCPHTPAWLQSAEAEFTAMGVPINHAKTVDDGVSVEFQGAVAHGTDHWLGCSVRRRVLSTASTLSLLGAWRVAPVTVERLNGELGYDSGFRTCTRSVLQDIYPWIEAHRSVRRTRLPLAASALGELAVSALLAPFKQVDMRAPYCPRLECVGAAPGGHGRAWANFDPDLIHELCRLYDGPGAPTSLYSEYGIDLDKKGRCPLLRVKLPSPGHWCTAHKAGGFQHITLEEADATLWAAEAKLRRPTELFARSALR